MTTSWPKFLACLLSGLLLSSNFAIAAHPSRARGAILFMNYCSGCHSLRYLSWSRMIEDLQLMQHNTLSITPSLQLSLPNLSHSWPQIALASGVAQQWFGKPPPDLSLISRQRGSLWVKTYLLSFYPDPNQRFGVNNHRFPNSKMPFVLESLQHEINPENFASIVADIVYFLDYTAEPAVLERTQLGWFILGFLVILCGLFGLRLRLR